MRVSVRPLVWPMMLSLCVGCASMQSPFARKEPDSDTARRRMIAEMNARAEKGDIEGARQILQELDGKNATARNTEAAQPGMSASEKSRIIDELLTYEPPAERERKRALYAMYSPSRLRAMHANLLQADDIGQHQLNTTEIAAIQTPQRQPSQTPVAMTPARDESSGATAPDPRQSVTGGVADPWSRDSRAAQPASGPPLLPESSDNRGGIGLTSGQPQQAEAVRQIEQLSGTASGSPSRVINPEALSRYPTTVNPFANDTRLPEIRPAQTGFETTGAFPVTSGSGEASNAASLPSSPISQNPFSQPESTGLPPANGNAVQLLNPVPVPEGTVSAPVTSAASPLMLPTGGQTTAGQNNETTIPTTRPDEKNAAQRSLPGVLGDRVQSLIPSIRNAAEKTLPGMRPQNAVGAPATAPASHVDSEFANILTRLEADLAAVAPGQTEAERLNYVRLNANLRLLQVLAGRVDQAVEPIRGLDPADQEFWQQLTWSLSTYFDAQGIPESGRRATQAVEQLRSASTALSQKADLQLRNVTFCHRIISFGNYERFSQDRFAAGAPVVLYAEVENFTSQRVDSEGFRTLLQPTVYLYRAGDETKPIETIPFEQSEDFCRSIRRDYYLSHTFPIPLNLSSGRYVLVLKVADLIGNKVSTTRLNFEVAASSDRPAR